MDNNPTFYKATGSNAIYYHRIQGDKCNRFIVQGDGSYIVQKFLTYKPYTSLLMPITHEEWKAAYTEMLNAVQSMAFTNIND